MKRETRDRLLEIADAKVQGLGLSGLDVAVDQACSGFEKLAKAMSSIRTREGLIATLDRVELTQEQERYLIPLVIHFPHVIREIVTHVFESALRDLPAPPTGRRPALTSGEADEVCHYVAELYGKNTDLEVCKKRAAQRFGVSLTTVQRAWRKRGRRLPEDVQVSELVEYVKAGLFKAFFDSRNAPKAVLEECKEVIAATGTNTE